MPYGVGDRQTCQAATVCSALLPRIYAAQAHWTALEAEICRWQEVNPQLHAGCRL